MLESYKQTGKAATVWFLLQRVTPFAICCTFLSGLFSQTLAVCLVVVSEPKLGFWLRDVVFLLLTFHLLSSLWCWYTPPPPCPHPPLVVLFYSSGNCFMSPSCSCIKNKQPCRNSCRLERSHLGNRPFSAAKHTLSFQTDQTVTLSAYESRSLWLSGKCGNCFKTCCCSALQDGCLWPSDSGSRHGASEVRPPPCWWMHEWLGVWCIHCPMGIFQL